MIENFDMSYFDLVRIYKGEQVPDVKSYKTINVVALRKTYDSYGTRRVLIDALKRLPSLAEESVSIKKWIIRELNEEMPRIYEKAEQEEDGRSIIFTWRNK